MCIVKGINNEYVEEEEILYKGKHTNKGAVSYDEYCDFDSSFLKDLEEQNNTEIYDIFKSEIYDKLMNELTELFKNDNIKYYHYHLTKKYFDRTKQYDQFYRGIYYTRKCNGAKLLNKSPIIKNLNFCKSVETSENKIRNGIEILNKRYKDLRVIDLKLLLLKNDTNLKMSKMKKRDLILALMKL